MHLIDFFCQYQKSDSTDKLLPSKDHCSRKMTVDIHFAIEATYMIKSPNVLNKDQVSHSDRGLETLASVQELKESWQRGL